jgi:hypothetical protein
MYQTINYSVSLKAKLGCMTVGNLSAGVLTPNMDLVQRSYYNLNRTTTVATPQLCPEYPMSDM